MTWYVNPSYDENCCTEYTPAFTFPVFTDAAYQSFMIDWGDNSPMTGPLLTREEHKNLQHLYTKTGVFEMKLLLYATPDGSGGTVDVFNKKVMNRNLDASFRLAPKDSRRCMEWGGDSVKFILTGHDNPPGTKYEILVNSDVEKLGANGGKKFFDVTWIDSKVDSAWIVALEPTGTYGARVGISLSWEGNGVALSSQPGQMGMFWVYRTPSLRDIYDFTDTIATGDLPENFQYCIPNKTPLWVLDTTVLAQYQYRSASNSTVTPYYKSINNKLFFDVKYFWTDSMPTKDTKWKPVTDSTNYVDTTMTVNFRKAGFYKMRLEAYNQCGYDVNDRSNLLYVDTLWTDSVKDSPVKRYIQVFEQAENKIECRKDSACLESPSQLVIVDRNTRVSYDAPPNYNFVITELAKGKEVSGYGIQVNVYKGGSILTGDLTYAGCDSTEIILTLKDTGDYAVEMTRKCEVCEPITVKLKAYVGDKPGLLKYSIEDDLFINYNFLPDAENIHYQKCDSFRYALQKDLWADKNFSTDSVYFYMRKGTTRQDTILNYAQLFYNFDSVGNTLNMIQAKAHNYCGWGNEVSAEFYTRTKPEITVLRDSMPDNDSLCLDFDYHYYIGGVLPERDSLVVWFDHPAYVNGVLNGDRKQGVTDFKDRKIRVRHPAMNEVDENFILINKDMRTCTGEFRDTAYVIAAPDSLIYRDSILYCEGLTVMAADKLFAPDRNEFKKAGWMWNKTNSTEKFPEFNFTPDVDTLRYKLSNSKGCYTRDEIVFKPRKAPELVLAKEFPICLPDTIKDFKSAGYITYTDSPEMFLSVYKTTQSPANLLCSSGGTCAVFPLTPFVSDTLSLIYVLKNTKVDTAFGAGCFVADTVDLLLHRPLLNIRKADTLSHPWETYSFSSMIGFIDTSYLVPASLLWTVVRGTGTPIPSASDQLFGLRYRLSNSDKTLDELHFELSAQTRCGKTMKDTLVVIVAHGKLEGYKDVICFDGSYPLWNKVKSSFIDESSLSWEICYPTDPAKQGTLSDPSIGSSVTYMPYTGVGRSDSVRICVKGEFDQAPGLAVTDTIVLKMNQAPEITVLTDTLIAEDHMVNILKISDEWFKTKNIVSYKIDEVITANNGLLANDSLYYFTGDPLADTENRYAQIRILMDGLAGCPQVSQEFTLLDFCDADFEFRRPIGLCAGDVVNVDTIYDHIKGFDKYTVQRWTLEGDSPLGSFDSDSSHYTAPLTCGDRRIKLETSKSFKTYNGHPYSDVLPVVRSVNVTVHQEPSLVLDRVSDTLCYAQDRLEILRTWVSVIPDFYKDSLRLNGAVFNADYDYLTRAGNGEKDSIVFTVSQGSCTKWADRIRDTLFLYRLPEMIAGSFSMTPVCEMGTPVVDISGLAVAAEAKDVYWESTGGTVTNDMPPMFTPTLNSRENGSLTLHVQPPKGCPEETLGREFDIYRMPVVSLQSDTVCRIPGQYVVVSVSVESGANVLDIQRIDWYREGSSDLLATTFGLAALNYVADRQDSIAGGIRLVAQAWPLSPCDTWFVYDTVEIVLQDKPGIVLKNTYPSVCQGEETDLSEVVLINNAFATAWSKKPTTAGTLNGTQYHPGEYWGSAEFVVQADGMHGCPQVVKDVVLTINHAPLPQGNIVTPVQCRNDTVSFNAITMPGVAAVYEWNFGDNSLQVQGENVNHIYTSAGVFQVGLIGKYGSCERRADLSVTVNEKPTAVFNPDAQVSIGVPVAFVSESAPSDVSCKWYFDNGTGVGTPCYHIFTGNSGDRKVILEVTTDKGCQDTVSHVVLAVNKPVADFEMRVDSCQGVVDIVNKSERNFADVVWHFGNGASPAVDWEPLQQAYRRIYNDTVYYVKLTLKNVAGSDSLILPVKMVSKLEAKFEVMAASGQCNKLEKEIHIQTQGKADSVKVWWGDGAYEKWGGDQGVVLRKHRYINDSTVVKYFPLVLAAENACKKDTTLPVAVAIYPRSVKAKVILDTNYRDECYGVERGFENKSFGFTQAGYHCEWLFESGRDIVTDNRSSVAHVFTTPGEYQVKLRVYDNCNEDIDSVFVRVHGNDSLDFVVENGIYCSGKNVRMKFVQKGSAPFGDFRWEFQDGATLEGREAVRTFVQGVQVVKLTAVADGCRSLPKSKTIQIHQSPEPLISKPVEKSGCQPFEVEFEGRNGNNGAVSALWDFKDEAFSNKLSVNKTFETAGLYNVSFRLTSDEGCVDSVIVPIHALPTPSVKMNVSNGLFCTESGNFELSCINISPDAKNSAFEWWRDNQMVSLQSDSTRMAFHNTFGKVVVKLKAIHQQSGCVAEQDTVIVSARQVLPTLQLEPPVVCLGVPVRFINTSVASGVVELDLGDGNLTNEYDFEHIYDAVGDYPVTLKITSAEGCSGVLEKMVKVNPMPEAVFTWSTDYSLTGLPDGLDVPDKANGGIQFTNLSRLSSADGDTLRYRWDFGDDSPISIERSPNHLYPNNGNYPVTLHAASKAGCADSVSLAVFISVIKGLYIPTAFVPAVEDDGVSRFLPKGIGLHEYKIRVYDAWGACVWMSDKLEAGQPVEWWDGTFKGEPLPGGLYKWKVSALFKDGTTWEDNDGLGYVLLVR